MSSTLISELKVLFVHFYSAGLNPSLITAAVPSSNPGVGMWQGSGCLGFPVSSTT